MKTVSIIVVFIFAFSLKNYAQNFSREHEIITNQLLEKYEIEYLVLFVQPLDSALSSNSTILSTSNSSLNEKILFIASSPNIYDERSAFGIFGIFQNDILWDSGPVVNSYSLTGYDLNSIGDINKDGKTEIITSWFRGNQLQIEELWIFSWDGSRGQIISNILSDSTSSLYFITGSTKFVDTNLDGILEIMGSSNIGTDKLFSWNGIEYNLDKTEIPTLPRDGIELYVKSIIEFTNGVFNYKYELRNDSSSLQSVEDFYISKYSINFFDEKKPSNWSFSPNVNFSFVRWHVDPILKYHSNALIEPGSLEGSFSFYSYDHPRIVTFFSQGNNGELNFDTNSLIQNSFKGYTLGPWLPDSTMSLDSFTDTLETFRYRSCEELGWATDAAVCGQLEEYLTQVKTSLLAQDSVAAANALSDFIEKVEQEKDASLTSEGYALLYFNAEYLAERLPEPE